MSIFLDDLVDLRHVTFFISREILRRGSFRAVKKMASVLLCRGLGQVARRTALVSSARTCFVAPPVDPLKGKTGTHWINSLDFVLYSNLIIFLIPSVTCVHVRDRPVIVRLTLSSTVVNIRAGSGCCCFL